MSNTMLSCRAIISNKAVGIMLVAGAYFLSAFLGNFLAFTPSGASPFWPAAGVALAVLMIGGVSLWPGILLGDFLFNILNDTGVDSVVASMAWSAVDTSGPTLQAILGAIYIAKNLQGNLEGDFARLLKTYLIGVLLVCTISPSIGVSVLYMRELISGSNFFSTWFSWWIGDSIGVVLFAPLILWFAFNIKNGKKAKYSLILPPLTLMVVILVSTMLWFQNSEKETYISSLSDESYTVAEVFTERLLGATNAIESLKRYISIVENLDEDKLTAYTNQVDEIGIASIGWMPRVGNSMLEDSPVVPGFESTRDLVITTYNEAQELVPVASKDEYFPVVYTSDNFLNGRYYGFDTSSIPEQQVYLEWARDNAETVLTDVHGSSLVDTPMLVFYTPVFMNNINAKSSSVEERQKNLRGYISGVINPTLLISSEAVSHAPIPLAFTLTDTGAGRRILLTPDNDRLVETGSSVDSKVITMFGRELIWEAYAGKGFWVPGSSVQSRIFQSAALACMLLFSIITSNTISRARMISEKVIERTKELSLSRAKLGQALDIANVLAWSVKLPERIVVMDDRGFDFFKTNAELEGGYSFEADQWFSKFVSAEDRKVLAHRMFEQEWFVDSKESREVEGRVCLRDGELRDVVFRFSAQFDGNGNVVELLGTAQDVTQRLGMVRALQQSEEYSRSFIESTQDCIKMHTLDGIILSITDQGMDIMSIPDRELVINVDWLSFWPREQDKAAYKSAFNKARSGKTGKFRGYAETMLGEPKWWDVQVSPIFDVDGNVMKLLSVSRDITAETNAKLALEVLNRNLEETVNSRTMELAESEKRYRSMFESNPIPMWVFDDITLKFTAVNRAAIENYGYSEDEFLSMTILEIRPEEEREKTVQLHNARGKNKTTKLENVLHKRKDGSTLNVDITSHEVVEGSRRYRIVLSNDITERLNANAELRKQQDLTRLVLENLAEGVVACDTNGELIMFNKAAREWHGTDPRTMPAENWGDYYSLFEADGVTPLVTARIPLVRAFNGEQVRNSEMSICRKGMTRRSVVASGEPLLNSDGRKVGAVVVMHDITGRKNTQLKLENSARQLLAANEQIESERATLAERVLQRTAELTLANEQLQVATSEAEAASRAKSSFLAAMSHEIRTPMNGIVGMVDVLSHSNLEEQHSAYVKTIKDSAFSLLGIIDDVLDFSKIEASRMEMEREQFSLTQVAEGVVDTLAVVSRDNGVSVRVFVEPELPRFIWGDAKRLRQILMNLVGNAIKFSSGRKELAGEVRISVERDSTDTGHFLVRVKDNGIGITAEQIPKLFTSFSQAETSTTRVFGGTGLGLAISKRLVELMNGSICVSSGFGVGSEFSVRLPLDKVSTQEAAHSGEAFDLSGLNCVLVNFKDEDFDDLSSYLGNASAQVARVESLASATSLCIESPNDKVIVVCNTGLRRPTDEMLEALIADHRGFNIFLINSGRRCNPRVLRPGLVSMDDVFIRQYEFLHGVAVTAGIESALGTEQSEGTLHIEGIRSTSIAEARSQGRLILVAEDDKTNQKVILRQLSMLGYAAEVASNGEEAWEMWQSGNYACVLSDLHMPKMDGYSLTQKIRAAEPETTRSPILILTANALSGEAERAKALGVDEYLTKPLQLKVLNEALNTWLPRGDDEVNATIAKLGPAANSDYVNLDLSVLIEAIGEDSAVINEVLVEYLASALEVREELFTAIVKGQVTKISSLAHRLKGSSRIVGALRLGDLCAELENAGRSEDYTAVKNFMPVMDAEFEVVVSNIRKAIAA